MPPLNAPDLPESGGQGFAVAILRAGEGARARAKSLEMKLLLFCDFNPKYPASLKLKEKGRGIGFFCCASPCFAYLKL